MRYRVNGGSYTALTRAQSIDVNTAISGLTLGDTVGVQVATVNEQGTSAWSAETTLTLSRISNGITALATGIPAYASIPLTWTAPNVDGTHSAALLHLVEYKKASDSTWSTSGTVTGTSAVVSGLTDGTSHNFRITPINAAGKGPVSAPVTASTVALPAPLDAVATASGGSYLLRRGRAAFVGSAIRVRRDSDGTEMNIGFVGANLDTSALSAFVGPSTGRVSVWYDQSPAGVNFTQSDPAAQPIIVNAGTLVAMPNGAPALQANGTTTYMTRTAGFYAAGAASSFITEKGSTGNGVILMERRSTTIQPTYSMLAQYGTGALASVAINNDAGTALVPSGFGGAAFSTTVAHQVSTVDNGSSFARWVDGAAVAPVTYTRSGTLTVDTLGLFANVRGSSVGQFWGGLCNEVLIYPAAIGTADRQALEASQKSYTGTP